MSGSRTKKVRAAFENVSGFTYEQRGSGAYNYYWRQFKKGLKRR